MKLLTPIFTLLFASTAFSGPLPKAVELLQLDKTYHEGQREFHSKNYDQALTIFEDYLKKSLGGTNISDRPFWVVDQVGYIYLRVKKDPEGAVKFFKKIEASDRFNAAQSDILMEWIGVANDWAKEKAKPQKVKGADKLFTLGKKYFERGMKKKTYPMDDKGNADLAIAETYLRPFTIHHDNDNRIGQALLMMGRIKSSLRTDADYWSENFYLKEVIRRFPGTVLAQHAWKRMNNDIRIGYSGSSGDHTPASLSKMLSTYKKLAFPPKAIKKKKL